MKTRKVLNPRGQKGRNLLAQCWKKIEELLKRNVAKGQLKKPQRQKDKETKAKETSMSEKIVQKLLPNRDETQRTILAGIIISSQKQQRTLSKNNDHRR